MAKNVFQVAISKSGKIVSNQKLSRKELSRWLANHPSSAIFMEACYSAHYWGRVAQEAGHTVKLIPVQHVTPFIRGNKKTMLGISKRGDAYLRKQLIHGARALMIQVSKWPDDALCQWLSG